MESCEYIAVVYGQHFIPADTILQALDARFNFSRCKGTWRPWPRLKSRAKDQKQFEKDL